MRLLPAVTLATTFAVLTAPFSAALAESRAAGVSGISPVQMSNDRLHAEDLYYGWRASSLIKKPVHGWNGVKIGTISEILVGGEDRIVALVVRGGGLFGIGEAVFAVPWERVDLTAGRKGIRIPVTKDTIEELGLYEGPGTIVTPSEIWRVSELIGDPARLTSLVKFGTVEDVVFSIAGRGLAVLVQRQEKQGSSGGTIEERHGRSSSYAFAFPLTGPGIRKEQLDYYPLLFDSADAAARAPRVALNLLDTGLF